MAREDKPAAEDLQRVEYITQLEQERAQMEDQIGGLHDELRQAQASIDLLKRESIQNMKEFVANEEAREAHTGEMYMAQQYLRDVVARTFLLVLS